MFAKPGYPHNRVGALGNLCRQKCCRWLSCAFFGVGCASRGLRAVWQVRPASWTERSSGMGPIVFLRAALESRTSQHSCSDIPSRFRRWALVLRQVLALRLRDWSDSGCDPPCHTRSWLSGACGIAHDLACLRQHRRHMELAPREEFQFADLPADACGQLESCKNHSQSSSLAFPSSPKISVTLFELQRTALWTPRETMRKDRSPARAKPCKGRGRIWRA